MTLTNPSRWLRPHLRLHPTSTPAQPTLPAQELRRQRHRRAQILHGQPLLPRSLQPARLLRLRRLSEPGQQQRWSEPVVQLLQRLLLAQEWQAAWHVL